MIKVQFSPTEMKTILLRSENMKLTLMVAETAGLFAVYDELYHIMVCTGDQ
jgi:hypothetical protein